MLKKLKALEDDEIVEPRFATDEELELIHDAGYIRAVKQAGEGKLSEHEALNYGLGTEDTPIFQNMHQASSLIVGATLTAVDHVMMEKSKHALNLGGGLHHGFRGKRLDFVYIMTAQWRLNILSKNMGQGCCTLTRMRITEMVFNGRFTMSQTFAHYLFMKLGDIYFLGQEQFMSGDKVLDTVLPLIFR